MGRKRKKKVRQNRETRPEVRIEPEVWEPASVMSTDFIEESLESTALLPVYYFDRTVTADRYVQAFISVCGEMSGPPLVVGINVEASDMVIEKVLGMFKDINTMYTVGGLEVL